MTRAEAIPNDVNTPTLNFPDKQFLVTIAKSGPGLIAPRSAITINVKTLEKFISELAKLFLQSSSKIFLRSLL